MSFLLLVLGVDCFLMAFAPKERSGLVLVLFSLGRFASAAASSLCWLYTAELYPTNLRSQAVGTCSLISRYGFTCAHILSKVCLILFVESVTFLAASGHATAISLQNATYNRIV